MIAPPPLRPGDTVAVVAPSSPFDRALFWRGVGWLAERYRVRVGRDALTRTGYLAGSDERRLDELARALASGARAVIAARGGYGLGRIAHRIDWRSFAASPTWLVGFSDVTALHVEAAAVGVASLHGPMACSLGRGDERARRATLDALEAPLAPRRFAGLVGWRGGRASGPLCGGNLAVLHACAAAGRLRLPDGGVVLLEDVGERPYRVDRMLTGLAVGGHLARASAIVLGEFTDCLPGPDGVTVGEVLRERLASLGVPLLAAAPFGHGARNLPVTLGAEAHVDADAGTLSLG